MLFRIIATIFLASHAFPVYAKSIGEALSDMGLQDTDPRGVILMIACICLLVGLASALIVTTLKLGKKNPKN